MVLCKENKQFILKVQDSCLLREDKSKSLIYTIGNINGDLGLLQETIESIEESTLLASNDKIVFLGNFISAKGDSSEVISLLKEYQEARPDQVVIIRGANEQRMIQSKRNFYQSELGKAVLKCYRIPVSMYTQLYKNRLDIKRYMEHVSWLSELPMCFQSEKFFFVHAGVDPEKDLQKQMMGGFMFISNDFYKSQKMFSHLVVHSVPEGKSCIKQNRIGIGCADELGLRCFVLNDKKSQLPSVVEPWGKIVEETMLIKHKVSA